MNKYRRPTQSTAAAAAAAATAATTTKTTTTTAITTTIWQQIRCNQHVNKNTSQQFGFLLVVMTTTTTTTTKKPERTHMAPKGYRVILSQHECMCACASLQEVGSQCGSNVVFVRWPNISLLSAQLPSAVRHWPNIGRTL